MIIAVHIGQFIDDGRVSNSRCAVSTSVPSSLKIAANPATEGDLIVGPNHCSAIGTLVERKTRTVRLVHLPSWDSDTLRDAVIARMADLPSHLARSITWDQGTEMARHTGITAALKAPVYFCDSHSPWQRSTNENTNGPLEWSPKVGHLDVWARYSSGLR